MQNQNEKTKIKKDLEDLEKFTYRVFLLIGSFSNLIMHELYNSKIYVVVGIFSFLMFLLVLFFPQIIWRKE